MRNLKKFLALVLAVMMVMGLMVTVNAKTADDFGDADDIDPAYKEAMDLMVAIGLTAGDGENLMPEGKYDRAMLATQLYILANGDAGDDDGYLQMYGLEALDQFTDLRYYADYRYAVKYINYAAAQGWVNGIGDSKYNPGGTVTIPHVLLAMLNVLGLSDSVKGGPTWELDAIQAAKAAGIVDGKDANLVSTKSAQRQEAFQIIFNAMTYSPSGGGTLYKATVGSNTQTFPTVLDAWLFVNANGGGGTVEPVEDTSDSLLTQVYGVTKDSVTNELGETVYGWVKDGEVLVETGSSTTDVYTYSGAYAANAVINDLKAKGVTKYDANVVLLQNGSSIGQEDAMKGQLLTTVMPGGDGAGLSVLNYYTANAGVNNNIVKVYVSSATKTVTKIVVINIFSAVLARGNFDSNGNVTLKYPGWDDVTAPADGLAVGDVVTWYRGADKDTLDPVAVNVQKIEGFEGKLTSIRNPAAGLDAIYNIDGSGYKASFAPVSGFTVPTSIGAERIWYIDELEHIIYAKEIEEEEEESAPLAIIDDISYADGTGAVDDNKYISARLAFMDGSTAVVKVTAIKSDGNYYAVGDTAPTGFNATANGTWVQIVDSGDTTDTIPNNHIKNAVDLLVKNAIFEYSVNSTTGYYTLTNVDAETLSTATIKTGDVKMSGSGTPGTVPVNSKTVFLTLGANGAYSQKTVSNVGNYNAAATVYYLADENGVATYVFVKGTTSNPPSQGNEVFILWYITSEKVAGNRTNYTYAAIIDGEVTEFTVSGDANSNLAPGLYVPTTTGTTTTMGSASNVIHGAGYSLSGGTLIVSGTNGDVVACDDNDVPVFTVTGDEVYLGYTDELSEDGNDEIFVVTVGEDIDTTASYIVIFEKADDGVMEGSKEFFEELWPDGPNSNGVNTEGVADGLAAGTRLAITWNNDGKTTGNRVCVVITDGTDTWIFPISAGNVKGLGKIALNLSKDFTAGGGNMKANQNNDGNAAASLSAGKYDYQVLVGTHADDNYTATDIETWTSISSGFFSVKLVGGVPYVD